MIENEDYRLLPSENSDYWNVLIMNGPYLHTKFNFDTLRVTEDGENLAYSVNILETPDPELTTDDPVFQQVTGEILTSIIESAIEEEKKTK